MVGESAPKLISTKSSLLPFDDEGWQGENVASIARVFLRVQVGWGKEVGKATGKRSVGGRARRRRSMLRIGIGTEGCEKESEVVKDEGGKYIATG